MERRPFRLHPDSIRACDKTTSVWKSGDLPEDTPVTIYAVTVNGGITLEKGGALWSKE
ncbi:hypothetical protein [Streptomyces koyangensis]